MVEKKISEAIEISKNTKTGEMRIRKFTIYMEEIFVAVPDGVKRDGKEK